MIELIEKWEREVRAHRIAQDELGDAEGDEWLCHDVIAERLEKCVAELRGDPELAFLFRERERRADEIAKLLRKIDRLRGLTESDPDRAQCGHCSGRGVIRAPRQKTCPKCRGTGFEPTNGLVRTD